VTLKVVVEALGKKEAIVWPGKPISMTRAAVHQAKQTAARTREV